jgi:hypothetical protein
VSHRERHSADARFVRWFAAGLVPPLALLLFFATSVAPPSGLLDQIATSHPLEKLLAMDRHFAVGGYMTSEFLRWGNWSVASPTWFVVCWTLVGLFHTRHLSTATLTAAATIALILTTYYGVYVLTPHDLDWHLDTSWRRLVAQLWPTIVWTSITAGLSDRDTRHPRPAAAPAFVHDSKKRV